MSEAAPIGYDVATALWQGARPYQEDTLLADFHGGMDRGFAVLADGMGGHAAGDLASRLVVIDAVSHLKFLMHDGVALEASLVSELTSAIETANTVLKDRAVADRRLRGMGATFLATVIFEDRLYWASVGDSPLYLWREGALRQLNEDHSMAPVIDQMARTGEITNAEAANHPDRNALTSVLMGETLKAMDVPKMATVLDPGDVLIQASDGLQYLDDKQISEVAARGGSSREIADGLMAALRALDDPAQDNTAVLVLQLTAGDGGTESAVAGTTASVADRSVMRTSATNEGPTPSISAPRAVTPSDVPRPAGARRWVLPASLVGGAAVVAGLVFGVPGGQSGPETGVAFETADVTAAAEPESAALDVVQPAVAVPETTAPDAPAGAAAPAIASSAPVSAGLPAVNATDVHEIVGETAALAEDATLISVPSAIGAKPSQSAGTQAARAANGATIPFDATSPGAPAAPGANAVGLDLLHPRPALQDAPQAPSQDAVEAQPESQRTLVPDGALPKFAPPVFAKTNTGERANRG